MGRLVWAAAVVDPYQIGFSRGQLPDWDNEDGEEETEERKAFGGAGLQQGEHLVRKAGG